VIEVVSKAEATGSPFQVNWDRNISKTFTHQDKFALIAALVAGGYTKTAEKSGKVTADLSSYVRDNKQTFRKLEKGQGVRLVGGSAMAAAPTPRPGGESLALSGLTKAQQAEKRAKFKAAKAKSAFEAQQRQQRQQLSSPAPQAAAAAAPKRRARAGRRRTTRGMTCAARSRCSS